MNEQRTVALFTLWIGCFFVVIAIALALGYYFLYRPIFAAPEVLAPVERLLQDPNASAESIRRAAIEGYITVSAGFAALDAAMWLLLFISLFSGASLLYVYWVLRRVARKGMESAL
jgi:hypothetical protein